MNTGKAGSSFFISGIIFSALWASASVASKIGLQSAQPFVLSFARFVMAAVFMLVFSHLILKRPLPKGKQWKQLALFGLLNVALYLGLFILAIGQVSAGLGSLAVALNPVLITVMYSLIQKQRPGNLTILSLILGFGGVLVCAYPLIMGAHATGAGILTLFLSMIMYSLGTIYFQKVNWQQLDRVSLNGWQTLFGALFILPVMVLLWKPGINQWNAGFWSATAWLSIAVSICAVQCWIFLLHHFGEKSSYWLFLSPIFGFFYSAWLTSEPLGILTAIGTLLVLVALWITIANKKA